MKKELLPFVLIITILISIFSNCISAVENDDLLDVQNIIDNIINYKLKESSSASIQEWIDKDLTSNAGLSSEWYILTLSQYGDFNFSNYQNSLLEYLSKDNVFSASSKEKYALCLIATGHNDIYISKTANSAIGAQGIMSLIFGLHILNNGYKSIAYDTKSLVNFLLSLQKDDGGWALSGNFSDVDVTAMAIQSLAVYYFNDEDVKTSIDKALSFLSSRQNDDGDFSSYGQANPESTSQVLMALSSLGIDGLKDERFIKNNNTILDGINKYKLDNGTYCHKIGDNMNDTATVQVLYSLVSYLRYKNEQTPFYIFDKADPDNVIEEKIDNPNDSTEATTANTETTTQINNNENEEKSSIPKWKIVAILVLVIISIIISLFLFLLGKRNKKNYIAILFILIFMVIVLLVLKIQSVDDYYTETKKDNAIGSVTISIRCDTLLDKEKNEYIPKNGIILDNKSFEIDDNDTVFDILIEASKKYKIQIDYSGNTTLAYISGINYLYEFDFGDLSGWVYEVNGIKPSVGCGEYKLNPGDEIIWHYTCDLGNDIK